jgi:hypothetical protein
MTTRGQLTSHFYSDQIQGLLVDRVLYLSPSINWARPQTQRISEYE